MFSVNSALKHIQELQNQSSITLNSFILMTIFQPVFGSSPADMIWVWTTILSFLSELIVCIFFWGDAFIAAEVDSGFSWGHGELVNTSIKVRADPSSEHNINTMNRLMSAAQTLCMSQNKSLCLHSASHLSESVSVNMERWWRAFRPPLSAVRHSDMMDGFDCQYRRLKLLLCFLEWWGFAAFYNCAVTSPKAQKLWR